jgi:hypothetical protein
MDVKSWRFDQALRPGSAWGGLTLNDVCSETSAQCSTSIAQLREAAIKQRRKIHDIVLEGIELALRKRSRRPPVTAI